MNADMALEVCKRCKAACCRLGGPWFTKADKDKVLKAGYPDFFVMCDKDFYELKSKKGVCPYLGKDDSCSIQDAKPDMCTSWPVFSEYDGGKVSYTIAHCPLTPLLSGEDIKLMKIQAGRIPKHLIVYSLDKSKLSGQEIDLILRRFHKFKRTPI